MGIYVTNAQARIGILGGSFDPVHFGHIKPTLELAEYFALNTIHLLPCRVSPFKSTPHASPQHRLNMLNLVAANSQLLKVDERELHRASPSYTYLTLQELAQECGRQTTLFWIMGMDALADFPQWYQAEQIMELCHILVLQRPGHVTDIEPACQTWLQRYLVDDVKCLDQQSVGCIFITDTEMLNISSTQIRQITQSGQQPRFLLPGGVWNYIKRNKLYQTATREITQKS